MDSCQYVNVFKAIDDKGTQSEKRQKCGLRISLRTVEFRHPEYKDLSKEFILCETHYREVFGVIEDEERQAWRFKENAFYRYKGDFAKAKNLMETGVGYFNAVEYKGNHYRKVEDAIRNWMNIRKNKCRLELCNTDLRSVRKVFSVRAFAPSGRDYKMMYFCCENHWKRKMYAVEPKKQEDNKVKPMTLDDYQEEIKA
ncbi:MAG: hypothetical protein KJI69_04335 [Patescibacteria group bacterium]|nr:hypothetical protein [Patescibacteria group bacterium]